MKYVLRKIHSWRIIADTTDSTVYVADRNGTLTPYPTRRAAFAAVAKAFIRSADLRNLQPGQVYDIPMYDGTVKRIQVQQQRPDAVQAIDVATGTAITIPHLQPGAEPRPTTNVTSPVKPAAPGAPTAALSAHDIRHGADIGREPYHCKHDGGYLYRKEPTAPEKYCAQCGMVYAAQFNARQRIDKEQKRKMFHAWKNRHRIVRAFELIAEPKKPGEEPMEKPTKIPSSPPVDLERKRRLTPHEIVDEAETLIRNALVRGIKIGTLDILENMAKYYDNNAKELADGIAIAWKKVQYEETFSEQKEKKQEDVDVPEISPDVSGLLQTDKLL